MLPVPLRTACPLRLLLLACRRAARAALPLRCAFESSIAIPSVVVPHSDARSRTGSAVLLSDFLRAYGHEWPATRSVQHMGVQSSYSSETVLLADDFAGNVTMCHHDITL